MNYMQRVKALEFSLPFTMYFIGYLVQAEIVMRLDMSYSNVSTIILAVIKFICMMTFVPLIRKYKLTSLIPVVIAGFVDVISWVYLIYADNYSLHIQMIKLFSDMLVNGMTIPMLLFYKFYIVLFFSAGSLVIDNARHRKSRPKN